MLNEYEQKKYDTISKFVSKEIDIKEAILVLNLKECQIYRLKKLFINEGKSGFIHKNRGKVNPNKIKWWFNWKTRKFILRKTSWF